LAIKKPICSYSGDLKELPATDVLSVGELNATQIKSSIINSNTNYVDADALHAQVFNNSGGILYPGQAVYASTHTGSGAIEVALAQANSTATMPAIGLIEEQIANGGTGSVRLFGILNGVNAANLGGTGNNGTSAWSDGQRVYVSPTVAGQLTGTKPTANAHLIQPIGTSVYQSATVGVINVNPGDVSTTYEPIVDQSNGKTYKIISVNGEIGLEEI
jgi:hypothetical protein